jgi:hypothetical protein
VGVFSRGRGGLSGTRHTRKEKLFKDSQSLGSPRTNGSHERCDSSPSVRKPNFITLPITVGHYL